MRTAAALALVLAGCGRPEPPPRPAAYLYMPPDAGTPAPALLSQTGAFVDVRTLAPAAGLVAYAVSQRSREMGVRVALGAEPSSLVRLVLGRTVALTLVGSAAGVVLALLAAGAVRGLLFGVTADDPRVLLSVVAIMLAAAMAASYLPARRILKQAPGLALRDA